MTYLTPAQVAERLAIGRKTVYALCAAGKLPHVRHGVGRGTIRVAEADLLIYLASCRAMPPVSSRPPRASSSLTPKPVVPASGGWRAAWRAALRGQA